MFAKPHQIFYDALKANYALGAFNTSNMEVMQGILRGAQTKQSPVILQTSEGAIEYAGLTTLVKMAEAEAKNLSVPVILHLDHGKDFALVKKCLDAGYTSVMIDASRQDLDENIRVTKSVVEYAHDRGAWVEAELGAIIGKEGIRDLQGGQTPEEFLTNPDQAKKFVTATAVDALAVSVGTIHGAFTGQEYIRFELLSAIQDAVPNTPLVLHGASGIADAHIRQAVGMHVCKVNVDTELRMAFERAVKAYFSQPHESIDPREILGPARDAVQQVVEHKINVFGSADVAKVY